MYRNVTMKVHVVFNVSFRTRFICSQKKAELLRLQVLHNRWLNLQVCYNWPKEVHSCWLCLCATQHWWYYTQALRKGKLEFTLGHLESLVKASNLNIIRSANWSDKVTTIAVDQAHCVVQWYKDLRPGYHQIGPQSHLPYSPHDCCMAMASVKMSSEIQWLLNMSATKIVTMIKYTGYETLA